MMITFSTDALWPLLGVLAFWACIVVAYQIGKAVEIRGLPDTEPRIHICDYCQSPLVGIEPADVALGGDRHVLMHPECAEHRRYARAL